MIKTNAIVLSLSKHDDRSMLLHAYTRERGYLSIYIYGAGGRRHTLGLYLPLNAVSLVVDTPPDRPARLRESTLLATHNYTPMQQMAALTIAEVALRSMHEPLPDPAVYELLLSTAAMLEHEEAQKIVPPFLVALSRLLGYGGQMLDEWNSLSSLAMYHELIQ